MHTTSHLVPFRIPIPSPFMNRFAAFLFFLLCLTHHTHAQSTISGTIKGSHGETPYGVSVLIHPKQDVNTIISYAISNDAGGFSSTFTSELDTVGITTHSLNFRDTTLYVANRSQNITFRLIPEVNQLDEVSVKGRPILAKEDTTSYIVNAFTKGSDESIGDVISRMPGFSVDADGKLSYMGRPIDKYYIEGMDLLEGRYNIANNNLSHDAVGAVEVLHNHQPIKMLRQQHFHDGTSVNLKLKNKYTAICPIKASVGYPFLKHSLNASPMLFSQTSQLIATVQTNNIGDDLSLQYQPFTISSSEIDNITNRKTELTGFNSLAPNFINNKHRYLFNHSNLISFNYLTKPGEDKELKTNLSFYNDWITEEARVLTEFYLENDTTRLEEWSQNQFGKNALMTDIIYNVNADEQYLNNKFRFENYWDQANATINGAQQHQKAYTPHLSLANEFDMHRMIGKHYISLKGFVDYNHSPQRMRFQPGVFAGYINDDEPYDQAIQQLSQNDVKAKAAAAMTLNHQRWAFSTEVGSNYQYHDLRSTIENDRGVVAVDSLRNTLFWSDGDVYLTERIAYETSALKLKINIPASLVYYDINDRYHRATNQFKRSLLSPSVYVYYKPFNHWEATGRLSYTRKLGSVSSLTQGFILKSYRSLTRGTNHLSENADFNLKAKIEYKDPIAGWFATLDYKQRIQYRDVLFKQKSLGDGIFQTEAVQLDNESYNNAINGECIYFIAPWQSTINVLSSYSYTKSQYLLNDDLGTNRNYMSNIQLGFDWGYWRSVQFKYRYDLKVLEQKTTQATTHVTEHGHVANLIIYPLERHWINLRCEYLNANNANQDMETFFGDISYSYKTKSGKFNYKLQVLNIFDSKTITQYNNSDISLVKKVYYIRPREILLSLSYRL